MCVCLCVYVPACVCVRACVCVCVCLAARSSRPLLCPNKITLQPTRHRLRGFASTHVKQCQWVSVCSCGILSRRIVSPITAHTESQCYIKVNCTPGWTFFKHKNIAFSLLMQKPAAPFVCAYFSLISHHSVKWCQTGSSTYDYELKVFLTQFYYTESPKPTQQREITQRKTRAGRKGFGSAARWMISVKEFKAACKLPLILKTYTYVCVYELVLWIIFNQRKWLMSYDARVTLSWAISPWHAQWNAKEAESCIVRVRACVCVWG